MKIEKLTGYGQVKEGDLLLVEPRYKGIKFYHRECMMVCNPGTEDEEIVIVLKTNIYFVVSEYLEGTSWAKDVRIVKWDQ